MLYQAFPLAVLVFTTILWHGHWSSQRLCLPTFTAQFNSVQSLSRVWLFATPWIAARQASLSITNSWSPPKPMSIESVMPFKHLILRHPLLLLPSVFPIIRVFSNESALCIRWPKYWSFSFNISPSNEHPGLISFRMDWLDLFADIEWQTWVSNPALNYSILWGFPDGAAAAAAAKSLQSCPTLCDPIDGSSPGSAVSGILQARTLEWIVISVSNAWKWKVKVKLLSCVWLFATPWTAAYIKNLPVNTNAGAVRDTGLIPGLGRFPGEGNGNPFQYSCLENPVGRGAWWATFIGLQRFGHDWSDFSSVQSLSHVLLFATPWTAACQASLSITNSRSLKVT